MEPRVAHMRCSSKQPISPALRHNPSAKAIRTPSPHISRNAFPCFSFPDPSSTFKHRSFSTQLRSAQGQGNHSEHDPTHDPVLRDYIEVKVDSVRVIKGGPSVVYLRLQSDVQHCLAVWIGDPESQALLREMQKEPKMRPMTHDVTKDLISAAGFRVTKVRITEIVGDTFYARIHVGKVGSPDLDVDARPSDAVNLAVRFKAPIYVHKRLAGLAKPYPTGAASNESQAEIANSVREVLAEFVDPTVMDTLHKELAIHEQRFRDAHACQQRIAHEMTHNRGLRLVVAMESALADGRYEEAARLRDEYRQLVASGGGQKQAVSVDGRELV